MNCSPAKKVTTEEHAGDFRRALELADKLTQDSVEMNSRLKRYITALQRIADEDNGIMGGIAWAALYEPQDDSVGQGAVK